LRRRLTKIRSPASCAKSRAGCATDFPTTDGERLDRYLVRLGWAGSRRAAVELISSDRVRVNGRRYRKGETIAPGDNIEVIAAPVPDRIVPNPDLRIGILFADAAVIVADKPAVVPCHPLSSGERDTVMNAIVANYPEAADAGDKPLEGGLIHRLDNGTSGALMITRHHEAFVAMREALRSARVTRRYRALILGRLDRSVEIATPIAHHPKNPRKMVAVGAAAHVSAISGASAGERYRSTPRPAVTRVEALSYENGFTLVRVTPRTGNRHQIRVHLASAGFPIAGDELYGGPSVAGLAPGRFWLHLAELEFESPASGQVTVSAPLARDLIDSVARL
jgi:23S rRNA pseudouridine1911/1915/1917 synthase